MKKTKKTKNPSSRAKLTTGRRKVAAKKVKSAKKKPVVKKKAVSRKRKSVPKMTQERFDQLMAEIAAI